MTDKQASFNPESKKSQGTIQQEVGADGDNKVFPVAEPSPNPPADMNQITERSQGTEISVDIRSEKCSDNPLANQLDLQHAVGYQEPTNMNESETKGQNFDTAGASQVNSEEMYVSPEKSKLSLSPGTDSLDRSHMDTESSISPENQAYIHSDNTELVAGKTEASSDTNNSLIVKDIQSVTLSNPAVLHSCSINPDPENTIRQDDKHTDSESEKDTSSDDESIPEKFTTQVAHTETTNGRKRKKKTNKTAYRKKREKKKGKREENKGAVKADNVKTSVVVAEVKHENTAKNDNEIKPHTLTESSAMEQDNSNENKDKLNPNENLVPNLSATPSAENKLPVNWQKEVIDNGPGEKIFGSLKDCDKNGRNNSEFEPREPPSVSSLFRVDDKAKDTVGNKKNTQEPFTKERKDTSNQEKQTKKENKNVQPNGAEEKGRSVTNENQDQTRVTRSQTQAKNKQTSPDQTNQVKLETKLNKKFKKKKQKTKRLIINMLNDRVCGNLFEKKKKKNGHTMLWRCPIHQSCVNNSCVHHN